MPVLRALASTVLALLVFVAGPAVAAGPYPPPSEGSGEVSQSRVAAGGCVTFSGDGFEPGSTVTVRDNGKVVGSTRAGVDGRFSMRVCFSASAKRGRHTLTGTGVAQGGGVLTVSASVIVTGVSQRPESRQGESGAPLPFTGGLAGPGLVLLATVLVAVGAALVLASGRRPRAGSRGRRSAGASAGS